MKDLWWLLAVLVVIWAVWVATGGPARYEQSSGVFMQPPAPLSSGETYGTVPEIEIKIPKTLDISIGGKAALGTERNLGTTDRDREYFTLVGISDTPVNISGWRVVGKKGISAVIPKGVPVFRMGQVNDQTDIYLAKGERAVIISGYPPVGFSFQLNSCSKYLTQFQEFSPRISKACPLLLDLPGADKLDQECKEYVNDMDRCTTPIFILPKGLSQTCREFIMIHASYNACVVDHEKNPDFLSGEWRVYLGKNEELWNDRDTIKFYDRKGNAVGTYTY